MKVKVKTPNGGQNFDTKHGVLPYLEDLIKENVPEIVISIRK